MTNTTPSYGDLPIEDSWIEYLRTRLPYSFNCIEEKGTGRSRHFVLSEPVFLTGGFAAERHNYWRRGNVYYMSGKLLDYFSMSAVGQAYRMQETLRLLTSAPGTQYAWPRDIFAFYNSMQMEKVWGFAQDNHLDRERVMMTNVIQAVELGLKAIMTHAAFRETCCFKFAAGHDVAKLYEALPDPLQDEIAAESKVFAIDYLAFRTQVETDIKILMGRRFSQPQSSPDAKQQADWDQMAKRIRESNYTAFVNENDPGKTVKQLHQGWFQEALDSVRPIEAPHDISQYFRYAPQQDKDELPVDLISWGLLLGRFLYEHLFPVPPSGNGPLSGFPLSS